MVDPISIDTAITAINLIITICRDIRHAPDEIKKALHELQLMEAALAGLQKQLGLKSSTLHRLPKLTAIIRKEVRNIKDDAKRLEEVVKSMTDSDGVTVSVMGTLRYAMIGKSQLADLLGTFAACRQRLDFAINNILVRCQDGTKAFEDETTSQLLELNLKLDDLMEKEERRATQRGKAEARAEKVLTGLATWLNESLTLAAAERPAKLLAELEVQLVGSGYATADARVLLMPISAALASSSLESSVAQYQDKHLKSGPIAATLEVPTRDWKNREPEIERRKSDSDTPSKPKSKTRSSSHPSSAATRSEVLTKHTNDEPTCFKSILCVDWGNNVRASLTQLVFEMIRLFTAHKTGRWLFRRVHSAGIGKVKEHLPAFPVTKPPFLDRTNQSGAFFQAHSDEAHSVLERLRKYNRKRISMDDIHSYDFIICFSKEMQEQLLKQRKYVRELYPDLELCKIIRFNSCAGSVDLGNDEFMDTLFSNIFNGIQAFIEKDLGDWSLNKCRQSTTLTYRTLQISQSAEELTGRPDSTHAEAVNAINARIDKALFTRAKAYYDYDVARPTEYVISILGQQRKAGDDKDLRRLKKAEKIMKEPLDTRVVPAWYEESGEVFKGCRITPTHSEQEVALFGELAD